MPTLPVRLGYIGADAVDWMSMAPSGCLSGLAAADCSGAAAYRRMKGLGRSGSSGAHLAGVAASRYMNVGAGIIVGGNAAVLPPHVSNMNDVTLDCESIDSFDEAMFWEGLEEDCGG